MKNVKQFNYHVKLYWKGGLRLSPISLISYQLFIIVAEHVIKCNWSSYCFKLIFVYHPNQIHASSFCLTLTFTLLKWHKLSSVFANLRQNYNKCWYFFLNIKPSHFLPFLWLGLLLLTWCTSVNMLNRLSLNTNHMRISNTKPVLMLSIGLLLSWSVLYLISNILMWSKERVCDSATCTSLPIIPICSKRKSLLECVSKNYRTE